MRLRRETGDFSINMAGFSASGERSFITIKPGCSLEDLIGLIVENYDADDGVLYSIHTVVSGGRQGGDGDHMYLKLLYTDGEVVASGESTYALNVRYLCYNPANGRMVSTLADVNLLFDDSDDDEPEVPGADNPGVS